MKHIYKITKEQGYKLQVLWGMKNDTCKVGELASMDFENFQHAVTNKVIVLERIQLMLEDVYDEICLPEEHRKRSMRLTDDPHLIIVFDDKKEDGE